MKPNDGKNHDDHDEPDEHNDESVRPFRLRLPSPLSSAGECVMADVITCAMAVHRELGPGFLESIYRKAMYIELEARGISYESERPVRVSYRGVDISGQRVDLIVENEIVVELKSVIRLDQVHVAQLVSYPRTTRLRGGLLINFRVPYLKQGLRRIVV